METQDEVVEKIKKLIRLTSSDVPAERESALLKARELCLKNELDISEIEAWGETKPAKESIDRTDLEMGNRMPISQKFISWLIQNHFNCKIIYCGRRYSGRRIVLIGKKSDVEIAAFINEFLNREFMIRWHEERNKNNFRTEERNSFFWGVYNGLDQKLKQTKSKFTESYVSNIRTDKGEDAANQVSQNYALMKISDEKRIDEEVKRHFPKLASRGSYLSSGIHSQNAMDRGCKVGRTINLNRPISSGSENGQIER